MKSNKKAFTIVELVIVIAVIAILAAVLIPTFSNMIKRSKVSADQQLIRNLNSALKADLKDHNTMTDALAAAAEFGYDVSKINKSATDNEILWDSKNDAFCYFESDKNDITYIPETTLTVPKDQVKDVDYWIIAKTPSEKYSTYLYNTELPIVENLKTGLDVGNETITSITYVGKGSAQSVTIRTTGGTLTVNAPDDEVTHYEFAEVVSVINVATASYHENGTVQFLEIAAGHIVLEKDAKVTALHFTATGEGDNAKFENAQGKQISLDISKVAKENLPSFSRDNVKIADNGTFVAKVTSDSDEFIWLFGSGVKERMVVVSSNAAIAEGGELKAGITAGCETGSVAEQIANPAKRNAQGQLVENDGVTIIENPDNAKTENLPTKEEVRAAATMFAGGKGTESNPYLIAKAEQWTNVTTLRENHSEVLYFKLVDDIDMMEVTVSTNNYAVVNAADFDLNGHTINNLDKGLVYFYNSLNIHDGTVSFIGSYPRISSDGATGANEARYTNLKLYGNAEPNSAPYYGTLCMYIGNTSNSSQRTDVYVDNVSSWVTIRCTGTSVGGLFGYCRNTKMNITNSAVYGNIEASQPSSGFLCGYGPQSCGTITTDGKGYGTISNNVFDAAVIVPSNSSCYYFGPNGTYNEEVKGGNATLNKTIDISAQISIPSNMGDEIKVVHSSASYTKYVVTLSFNVDSTKYNAGGYPRTLSVTIDNLDGISVNDLISTNLFKNYVSESTYNSATDTRVDSDLPIFTRNNEHVYFFDGEGYFEISNGTVYINAYAYGSDGSIKAVGSASYSGVISN